MRMMLRWTFALAAVAMLISNATAGDPKQAFLDAESAGPDFEVQGEYVIPIEFPADTPEEFVEQIKKQMTANGQKLEIGVQVIALGDGEFDFVAYQGGLPGDGANMHVAKRGKGKANEDGVTVFTVENEDNAIIQIKDGVFTVADGDRPKLVGKKVLRKSPTLGAKPPEGAVILFDGTSADAFKNGRIDDEGLLMEGVTSKELFQDFTIHIEFRLPFQPYARGQQRGNSGFYAQGRYEVQMLDSFGLSGADNECGGVYKIARPKVNMCYPPLSWQTYDIDFTAAKYDDAGNKTKDAEFTVKHNGVVIHDNQPLGHSTTASPLKEGPEPGPVYLQNHNNPVRYRNIWVVPK